MLRVIDHCDEPHARLPTISRANLAGGRGQAAWLPEPGRFKVKVLSADAPTASLHVELACSATKPEAWTLIEAAPRAQRRGRERAVWTATGSSAAPELNSGD